MLCSWLEKKIKMSNLHNRNEDIVWRYTKEQLTVTHSLKSSSGERWSLARFLDNKICQNGCQFGLPKAKISIANKSIMMENIYYMKWKSKLSKMQTSSYPKDRAVCLTASLKSSVLSLTFAIYDQRYIHWKTITIVWGRRMRLRLEPRLEWRPAERAADQHGESTTSIELNYSTLSRMTNKSPNQESLNSHKHRKFNNQHPTVSTPKPNQNALTKIANYQKPKHKPMERPTQTSPKQDREQSKLHLRPSMVRVFKHRGIG